MSAEDVFAELKRRDCDGRVLGARQADVDRVYARVGDQRLGVGKGLGIADAGHGASFVAIAGEYADDFDVSQACIGHRMYAAHRACAQDADPNHCARASPNWRGKASRLKPLLSGELLMTKVGGWGAVRL